MLAYSTSAAGAFTIELVRAGDSAGTSAALAGSGAPAPRLPVTGQVTIRALGTSSTRTFVLTGDRAVVARADVTWDSRLVPVAQADCDPPYTFDANGAKRWKPECL